jgi:hypothetical protein
MDMTKKNPKMSLKHPCGAVEERDEGFGLGDRSLAHRAEQKISRQLKGH